MKSTLHIIGTGPGDPELLTLKALNTIRACNTLVVPKASEKGSSTALSIIEGALDLSAKNIQEIHFPMIKVHLGREINKDVKQAWTHAGQTVINLLKNDGDVAFPTLGDPGIYSTGYYLYDTIMSLDPTVNIHFIPGIPAMSGCSAATSTPVCLGDDRLAVIPATFSEAKILETLQEFDAIVLMKVHKVMDKICRLLHDTGLTGQAVYVERAGMADERIINDLSEIPENPHYFSTIIVRKNGVGLSGVIGK